MNARLNFSRWRLLLDYKRQCESSLEGYTSSLSTEPAKVKHCMKSTSEKVSQRIMVRKRDEKQETSSFACHQLKSFEKNPLKQEKCASNTILARILCRLVLMVKTKGYGFTEMVTSKPKTDKPSSSSLPFPVFVIFNFHFSENLE